MSEETTIDKNCPAPRLCHIKKLSNFSGYGFNLHSDKVRDGQYIGKVEDGSPAQLGGLREGDRIVEVNGVDIGKDTHQGVVERVREKEDETVFLVVDEEADAFFKEKDIQINSSLPCVVRLETPDDTSCQHVSSTTTTTPTAAAAATTTTTKQQTTSTTGEHDLRHKARLCHLKVWPTFGGYGFNLHVNKETKMHFVGIVDAGSPAESAGLKENDIVIEVNEKNVQDFSHADVVKTIKEDPTEVRMLVVDEDALEYFRGRREVISHSSDFVEKIFCPEDNPCSCFEQVLASAEEPIPPPEVADETTSHEFQLRLCCIKSWDDNKGFGFNMQSEKSKPGQYIVKVDEGSPALLAGLQEKDFLLEVNGVSVEGCDHRQVVEMIKSDLKETKLLVVDPDAKNYFESKDVKMCGELKCIKTITSPDSNPQGRRDDNTAYVNGSGSAAAKHDDKENVATHNAEKRELILDVKNIPNSTLYSSQSSSGSPTTVGDVEFSATAEEARKKMTKKKQLNQQLSVKAKYELFQKM